MKRLLFLYTVLLMGIARHASAQVVQYDAGSVFNNGYARVQKGEKSFYIDTTGQYAFDSYELIKNLYPTDEETSGAVTLKGAVLVTKNGKQGALNRNGSWRLQPEYDHIETDAYTYWRVSKDNKTAIFSANGFELPFLFEDADILDSVHYMVKQQRGWGVYSAVQKQLVVPAVYEEIDYCWGCGHKLDYCYAKKDGKWGVVSFTGAVLIPFAYDHQHMNMRSDDWVTSFTRNGKQVVINIYTQAVTDCPDGCESELRWNFKKVKQGNKYGLQNGQGKLVMEYQYDDFEMWSDKYEAPKPYIVFIQNGKYGMADTTGKILLAAQYDRWPYWAGERFLTIWHNDKEGLADIKGKIISPPVYESVSDIYLDSLYLATKDEKMMLYNFRNQPVLQGTYDEIAEVRLESGDRDSGLVLELKRGKLLGMYNMRTRAYVEPKYSAIYFHAYNKGDLAGLFEVRQDDRRGVMDRSGKLVMPVVYDSYMETLSGYPSLVMVNKDGKYGVFDLQSKKELVPQIYSSLLQYNEDSSLLQVAIDDGENEKYGLVNTRGEVLLKPIYKAITLQDKNLLLLAKENAGIVTYSLFNSISQKTTSLPYAHVWDSHIPGLLIVARDTSAPTQLVNIHTGQVVADGYQTFTTQGYNGTQVVPGIFEFTRELTLVLKNGKMGLMNVQGKVILPVQYDEVSYLEKGYYLLVQYTTEKDTYGAPKAHYGYADSAGKVIVPVVYAYNQRSVFDYVRDNYLLLQKQTGNERVVEGLARKDGKVIIAPDYKAVTPDQFRSGFVVLGDKGVGWFDKEGKQWVAPQFDDFLYATESAFSWDVKTTIEFPVTVQKGNEYSYYSSGGKMLPIRFKTILPFKQDADVWGYPPTVPADAPAPPVLPQPKKSKKTGVR